MELSIFRSFFCVICISSLYMNSDPIFCQTKDTVTNNKQVESKNISEFSDIELMEMPKWSVIVGGGQSAFGLHYNLSLTSKNTRLRNTNLLYRYFGTESNQELRNFEILTMLEDLQTREWRVLSTRYFLTFEYLIDWRRIFAFDITLNHTNNQASCSVSCGEIGNLYRLRSLQIGTNFGAIAPSVDLLYGIKPIENGERHYKYTTIDPGFVFHILGESKFDPYLGFNLGFGSCSFKEHRSGTHCNLYRLGSRFGLRYHYSEGMFAQIQVERANVFFTIDERVESFSLGALWPLEMVNETITTFGFGMQL